MTGRQDVLAKQWPTVSQMKYKTAYNNILICINTGTTGEEVQGGAESLTHILILERQNRSIVNDAQSDTNVLITIYIKLFHTASIYNTWLTLKRLVNAVKRLGLCLHCVFGNPGKNVADL